MIFRRILLALILLSAVMAIGAVKSSAQIIPMAFWQSGTLSFGGSGNALRFRGAQYLSRTAMAGTGITKGTFSVWVKRSSVSTGTPYIFSSGRAASQRKILWMYFDATDQLVFGTIWTDANSYGATTTAKFRDPSAWYHIVGVLDTDNATPTDRLQIYVNGVRQNVTTGGTLPQSTAIEAISSSFPMSIGYEIAFGSSPFNGYMADFHFVAGTALSPNSFAQLNSDGLWVPKAPTGLTYGTSGFYLPFSDASAVTAAALGKSAVNSNDFTPNGFSVANDATRDVITDSPDLQSDGISNFATMNPLWSTSTPPTFSEGNLRLTGPGTGSGLAVSTIAPTSGKWYAEATVAAHGPSNAVTGIVPVTTIPQNNSPASVTDGIGYNFLYGSIFKSNATVSSGNALLTTVGDVMGMAVNFDAGSIQFYKNGVAQGSAITFTPANYNGGFYFAQGTSNSTEALTWNFGQRAFAYAPPSGFLPLNTFNLATPAVTNPSQYFKAVTYTGNGAYQSIGEPAKQTSSVNLPNSLRFRSDIPTYFSRSVTASAAGQKTFTVSLWFKRAKLNTIQYLFNGSSTQGGGVLFDSSSGGFGGAGDNLAVGVNGSIALVASPVIRDTSAWHHLVYAVDTNQPVDKDRLKLYVDGRQITAFVSASYPGQGTSINWNTTDTASIGRVFGSLYSFDGYMADFYAVDGQQLTPASFGEADAEGDWVPKAYAGGLGTNGFHLDFSNAADLGEDAAGSNDWVANNFTTNGNNPFTFNPSGFRVGNNSLINTNGVNYVSWNWKEGATPGFDIVTYTGTGAGRWVNHSLGAKPAMIITKALNATSGWDVGHAALNGGNAPFNNRHYALLNSTAAATSGATYWGGEPTSTQFYVGTGANQNASGVAYVAYVFRDVTGFSKFGSYTGNAVADGPFVHTGFKPAFVLIKRTDSGASGEWNILDNARDPVNVVTKYLQPNNDFAELSLTQLDFVSNGFKIRNSNTSGLNQAGTYIYAAFAESPFKEQSKAANLDLLSGLRFNGTNAYLNRTPASGSDRQKFTFSAWVKPTGTGKFLSARIGADNNNRDAFFFDAANKLVIVNLIGGSLTTHLESTQLFRDPATYGHLVISVDTTQATNTNRVRAWWNGQQITSWSTATFPTLNENFATNAAAPHIIGYENQTSPAGYFNGYLSEMNFVDGQSLTPTSFGEANSAGLWAPKAYSGTYGTNGFHLDFADPAQLGKDVAGSNHWTTNNIVSSNDNPFQFKPTGFQVGNNALVNTNANNYVSWNWKKGVVPGFDVVTYDGNGATSQSIAHNLGVVPSFMIVKPYSGGSDSWRVWHQSVSPSSGTNNSHLLLDYPNALNGAPGNLVFYGQPTSTVFTLGNNQATNSSGFKYVAYIFAEKSGFSKFGSYTGNGSADGPFVNTGFKPAYVLTKRTDSAGNWYVHDTARNTYNPVEGTLFTEVASAEAIYAGQLDFLSNGFKLRNTHTSQNATGGTYIYAAFAESPFKEQSLAASLTVANSLRFNSASTAYLSKTPASTGTNRRKWTMSAWVKRSSFGTAQTLLSAGPAGAIDEIGFTASDELTAGLRNLNESLTTRALLRDPAHWYHVVWSVDTTAPLSTVYIDGVVAATSSYTPPQLNYDPNINHTAAHAFGRRNSSADRYFNGYMADVNFVDGQTLTPASFGETNSAGAWAPKAYTGSYGTNGFHLEFLNAAAPGTDTSGAANTWTANNLTANDTVRDTPTTNFATLNPLSTYLDAAGPLTSGNLSFAANAGSYRNIAATMQVPSTGKWYWEATCDSESTYKTCNIGVYNDNYATTNVGGGGPGDSPNWWAYFAGNGSTSPGKINNASVVSSGYTAAAVGDTLQVAYDADTGSIWFGKNNAWQGASSPNPTTGTAAAYTGVYNVTPIIAQNWSGHTFNFGQGGMSGVAYYAASGGAFRYAPPTGFKALSTTNMAASAIPNPSLQFKPVTYTGTGTTPQTVAVGFQPDLTWIKNRSGSANHVIEDSSRLAGSPYLSSNTNLPETALFNPASVDNVIDTPTNNFATINPLDTGTTNMVLSKGNLTFAKSGVNFGPARGSIGVTSGKWYFEVLSGGGNIVQAGVSNGFNIRASAGDTSVSTGIGAAWDSRGYLYRTGAASAIGGYSAPGGNTISSGDMIMVAFDADTGKIWFGKNGIWNDSGSPAAGSGANFTASGYEALYPFVNGESGGTGTANFGQGGIAAAVYDAASGGSFKYKPPTGFKALSTTNMAASAILTPSDYFKAVLYTGTAANQNVIAGFSPDLTWIKNRTGAVSNHIIEDSVRVGTNSPYLSSNTTAAETNFFDAALVDNLTDVPTTTDVTHGNFATFNPQMNWVAGGSFVYSKGNLQVADNGTTFGSVAATIPMRTGQWYWEIKCVSSGGSHGQIGIKRETETATYPGGSVASYAYQTDGQKFNNSAGAAYGSSYTTGDIIGVAYDADIGTLSFYKNGVSQGSAFTGLTGGYHAVVGDQANGTQYIWEANFGQRPFAYTPPVGFNRLQSFNLANASFTPDLAIIKNRTGTAYHWAWYDRQRGPGLELYSTSVGAQYSNPTGLINFQNGGFTVGAAANVNTSGVPYISYLFKEGVTPGFDLVSWIGDGTNSRQIPHNLGVRPSMIIHKMATDATYAWNSWHAGLGTNYYIQINTNGAQANDVNPWPSAGITSSYLTTNADAVKYTNMSGQQHMAYVFADVPGFSKFGTYTGNGAVDGPFVYLGFKPAFVLFKNRAGGDWGVLDNARNGINPVDTASFMNSTGNDSGGGTYTVDFLANGLKIRNATANWNSNGVVYLYAAFAENPFKGTPAK